MGPLFRVEDALASCGDQTHELRDRVTLVDPVTGLRDIQIQSYLVNYLLAVIYAELEQVTRQLMVDRLCQGGDPAVVNFAKQAVPRAAKGMKISDLTGHLDKFGPQCKTSFTKWVSDPAEGRQKDAWDLLLTNRHDLAHNAGSSLTFEDVESSYRLAFKVLEHFQVSLALS